MIAGSAASGPRMRAREKLMPKTAWYSPCRSSGASRNAWCQAAGPVATSPTSIAESASLPAAMTLLRECGIHRLPVTRDGRVVGIVTGSDLLLAMLAPIEAAHDNNRREELQPSAEALAVVAAGE